MKERDESFKKKKTNHTHKETSQNMFGTNKENILGKNTQNS